MSTFLRLSQTEVIDRDKIEHIGILAADPLAVPPLPVRLAVRYGSGSVDEYALNSATARRLIRYFSVGMATDLSEE